MMTMHAINTVYVKVNTILLVPCDSHDVTNPTKHTVARANKNPEMTYIHTHRSWNRLVTTAPNANVPAMAYAVAVSASFADITQPVNITTQIY